MRLRTIDSPIGTVADELARAEARRVRAAAERRARINDMMLTTSARLNAEPAPTVERGDFGTRYDGSGTGKESPGEAPQIDWDALEIGLAAMSPAERAAILARVKALGGSRAKVNAIGGVTMDAINRGLMQRPVGDFSPTLRTLNDIAARQRTMQDIAKAHADFWAKQAS